MSRWIRLVLLVCAVAVIALWWSQQTTGRAHAPVGVATPAAATASTSAAATRAAAPAMPDAVGQGAPRRAASLDTLPAEATATLDTIQRGGPYRYPRDGIVFQNREGRLPGQPRGYYREYTVPTPGASDRGARRIVTGGDPPRVYYYTDDHYRTFREIQVRP